MQAGRQAAAGDAAAGGAEAEARAVGDVGCDLCNLLAVCRQPGGFMTNESDIKDEYVDDETQVLETEDGIEDDDGNDEGSISLPDGHRQAVMQPKDVMLSGYYNWFKRGQLNLNPDWQRAYVWKGKRPSFLIESVLMRLPIPVIFLARTSEGGMEVIDGVQRLTTIFNFLESKFALTGLEVFKELNGKRFKDLTPKMQSDIEDAVIKCFELSENTSQDLKFITFERINTGGMSLNEMEIRNCIYRGRLNTKLADWAKNEDFRNAINMRNLGDRMFDRSLILRFLAFDTIKHDKASAGIKSFLNSFFQAYKDSNDETIADFDKRFRRAMRNSFTVFGSNAFRLRKNDYKGGGEWAPRANAAIFQVIATSLAPYDTVQISQRADAIMEEYLDILSDQQWIDAVSKSTGDAKKIKYAFESWGRRLSTLMEGVAGLDTQRIFTKKLKEELYAQDKTCAICNNEIKSINDAAIDHVDQYWRGGATIPSNARLAHRACNMARPRTE
jgi:Protein of unknown function DUF262/HNH endonuclease